MSRVKRFLHHAYVSYLKHAPVERGKYRLGVVMDRLLGAARYDVDGLILLLSPVSLIDRKLIAGEGHDPLVVAEISKALREGGHFIDVGANFGYMPLIAARELDGRGKVFSFEPSPREFKRLLDHAELNRISNIVPVGKGIAPRRESGTLHVAGLDNPGMTSRYALRTLETTTVAEFIPIGDAIPESEFTNVRCVKIDVEGDEMNVLRAFDPHMPSLRRATFIVEITEKFLIKAGTRATDIYEFFDKHAFQPKRFTAASATIDFQYDEVFVCGSP